MEKVAVLGASNKEDRYSYKAVSLLLEHKHEVYPVHPVLEEVLGLKVYKNITELPTDIDTLTLYVNPKLIENQVDDIIKLNPKRVIFNPGTESEVAMKKISEAGIKVLEACTLILLKTGQY